MWKYLGWPLAVAAVAGAYFVYEASAAREQQVRNVLQEAQALNVQLSNRLAVVEAEYNSYKLAQEKEARERQLRERELGYRSAEPIVEKPATALPPEVVEPEPAPVRRTNTGSGRSIGNGVNSLLDRIRNGLSN